ncbi:MAG: murein biosynthesis integral membrane protein MurJ [Patescibacteria group bacterium]|jgi:putative peptidoglycan lipid II flippase
MWKRIKNLVHRENSLFGAAGILIFTMTLSNVLGLLRDHYLARNISTHNLDIYYAAFRIPDLIFNILIFGAISAAFIPVFTNLISKGGKADGFKLANTLITLGSSALIILSVILFVIMPYLTPLIVPNFDLERTAKTTELSRILLLSPIFFSVSYFIGGMLNSFKRFVAYSFAPIIYNLAIIFGAVFLAQKFGITAVTWCVIAGSFLHMLTQVPTAMNLGWKFSPSFDWRISGVIKVLRLMIPRAIGMGANNILLVVYTAISSALAAGSIAIFNLTNNIQTMPTVVFATSFSTAVFPALAHSISSGDEKSFSSYLGRSIRVIVYLLAPSTAVFILFRAQIIRLILGSGKFGWEDTKMAALTLGWFSFSLIAQGLIPLFAKAFYAKHDTKTPTVISIISIVVSIAIAYPLSVKMGVAGLALSFSIGSYLNALILFLWLKNSVSKVFNLEFAISIIKILVASLIMAVAMRSLAHLLYNYVDMQRFVGVLLQTFISIFAGVIIYLSITYVFGSQELFWAIRRGVNGNAEDRVEKKA